MVFASRLNCDAHEWDIWGVPHFAFRPYTAHCRLCIASAAQHFVDHRFYEDRLPCDIVIDQQAYLALYPDIRDGIEAGDIESATDHWIRFGRYEGQTAYLQRA